MASYGCKGLKVKTLGDLRKIMSLLEHLEDDYGIEFWEDYFDDQKTVIITDSIDVSYSCKSISVAVEIKENEDVANVYNKLTKYKRAFEILKKMNGINRTLFISAICDVATVEEIELLEELMKGEER